MTALAIPLLLLVRTSRSSASPQAKHVVME
jgi:hypothetical protein